MKKVNQKKNDELRNEYRIEDFPKVLVRGKYTKRVKESSNIVVLKSEITEVFPKSNEKTI